MTVAKFSIRFLLVGTLLAGCSREEGFSVAESVALAETPRIFLSQSPSKDPSFDVLGLSDDERKAIESMDPSARASLLEVYVGEAKDTPPMVGRVSIEQSKLHFEPRYPLRRGVRYRVVYHPARLPEGNSAAKDVVEEFEIEKPEPGPATRVVHIYPTAARLPENQLKFYLHFSAPMSRGEAYQRVHLLDAQGKEVDTPFLELGEELWDPGMTRFTLLVDPGRIKRGLKPREDVGPVFEAGRHYTLVVDGTWLDAKGQALAAETRKEFEVLPPDETPIDTSSWKIDAPPAGTSDPLVVRFGEPLDHSLLERVLHVVGPDGKPIEGSIETTDHETCWRFTPKSAWAAGDYRLLADTTLEDLAGNSIGRAFDVDVFERVEKKITSETVAVGFSVTAR